MDKRELWKYQLDKKENINQLEVKPRKQELKPSRQFIISVIGPRRAGKTYLLYDLILNKKKLEPENYTIIDFEDAKMVGADAQVIEETLNLHHENHGKKPKYIFLDEIQALDKWSNTIRTLHETRNHHIFITGSSSKLLSKELATSLRGRTITYTILPFSYKEYLHYHKIKPKKTYSTSQENKIKNHLRNYLQKGGFPDVVIEEEHRQKFFEDYLDLVVFRDLVERHRIQNIFIIKYLIKTLLSSYTKEFSVHKIYNDLRSQNVEISKNTLYNYQTYLEDAFFCFPLEKFSYSMKTSKLSLPKIYINDNGLVNTLSTKFSENTGKLMENQVFLELLRRKYNEPNTEIFYWKEKNKEVDFLVKKGQQVQELIQVCYDIKNKKTRDRETKTLLKAAKKIECENMIIITWDQESDEKNIKHTPLWKWLLENTATK